MLMLDSFGVSRRERAFGDGAEPAHAVGQRVVVEVVAGVVQRALAVVAGSRASLAEPQVGAGPLAQQEREVLGGEGRPRRDAGLQAGGRRGSSASRASAVAVHGRRVVARGTSLRQPTPCASAMPAAASRSAASMRSCDRGVEAAHGAGERGFGRQHVVAGAAVHRA